MQSVRQFECKGDNMKSEINQVEISIDNVDQLHIKLSCVRAKMNTSEEVFSSICEQSATNLNAIKWHKVASELAITYNKDSQSIEFMTKNRQDLIDLPRRLVEWQVIAVEDAKRLGQYINLHPLVNPLSDEPEHQHRI